MEFSVLQSHLNWVLHQSVHRAKNVLPVLDTMLLTAEYNQLKFFTTNLSWDLSGSIPAHVTTPGSVCFPVSAVRQITEIPETRMDFELNRRTQVLTAKYVAGGKHQSSYKCLAAEEYPARPAIKGPTAEIAAEHLRAILPRVEISVDEKQESRPVLTGIALTLDENGKLEMAGADGARASLVLGIPFTGATAKTFDVPKEALMLVRHLLGSEEQVTLTLGGDPVERIAFAIGSTVVSAGTIPYPYPNIESLFPKGKLATSALIKVADMRGALAVARLFTDRDHPAITFAFQDDTLTLSAVDIGDNTFKGTVPLVKPVSPFSFRASCQFVQDYFGATEGEEVQISVTANGNNIVLESPEEFGSRYLLAAIKDEKGK